jgi:hypothetical protein
MQIPNPKPHRRQITLLQSLHQTRFDIGSASILWDVEKESNVGGARDKDDGKHTSRIETVMKLRASGDIRAMFYGRGKEQRCIAM